MYYNDFKGMKLSALGFGAMRLPVIEGKDADINIEETAEMVDYALKHGINYFDTAYGYHGGNSERVMGRLLSKYPRDSYYLATKFPGYDVSNMGSVKEIFEEQIEKCGVDYFDFYLFHNVYENNLDPYLDEKNGILEYLTAQKKAGRIKHLGFSAHGDCGVISKFLEANGSEMEFCQIQLNYVDWEFQDAKDKVKLLTEHGLPIWVMEPLRGGRLANLTETEAAELRALRPDEEAKAWAFRFIESVPGVMMTLSGASSFGQLKENIETFKEARPLNEEEKKVILRIAGGMLGEKTLPCTACHYCTSHCPQNLDIPELLALYNEHNFTGGGFIAPMALGGMPPEKQPSQCIGCRSCEAVCPQQLKISEAMADFTEQLKHNAW
ncbi:MAG: aldo/keto reductase [Eubacteriaceae bacterium]|jgi:predicted aldo/keto reductase-like oxidoreductase|nr:aldo/keto reductase [Eubacteriaceae bacterium]